LEKITHEGSDSPLSDNLMLKDLLPASTSKFYRYSGSLTTPGCNEIVVWTVFESPIPISENQLAKFRQLESEDGPLVNNYRPVQPLLGRTVHIRSSASATVVSLTALIIPVLAWLAQ
jgi:carbonic anhydrase